MMIVFCEFCAALGANNEMTDRSKEELETHVAMHRRQLKLIGDTSSKLSVDRLVLIKMPPSPEKKRRNLRPLIPEANLFNNENGDASITTNEERSTVEDSSSNNAANADDKAMEVDMLPILDENGHRRAMLEDAYLLQQFERDSDEMASWINEQLKTARDDSYMDPTNIQGKLQKHANFKQELKANRSRLDEIRSTGEELIQSEHYAEELVRRRLKEVFTLSLWDELVKATKHKGSKLKEAEAQQQFNRNVEDIEMWLSEIEAQLTSEDCGEDLISVQNLQKKHALLESDINAHQERIDCVTQQSNQFAESGHFDAPNIKAKEKRLLDRYTILQDPLRRRRAKLAEAVRGQQLFRDIDDEMAWIREKEQVTGSTDRGRDLIGVQNLIKEHQALLAELSNHEGQINRVVDGGEEIAKEGHFLADEIRSKLKALKDAWKSLKDKAKPAKQHYAASQVADKRDGVLRRWSKLKRALIEKRSRLAESQTLQQFSRDASEIVQAQFAFKAKQKNHLAFNKGDQIRVLEKKDSFWRGEANGVIGWFPKSYITAVGFGRKWN